MSKWSIRARGEVAQADLPYAFDKQHPAKRIAIVAAGPLTNLALAVLLYGLSFSFGVTEIRPYVGMVEQNTIAAKAGFQPGDKIISVNGVNVGEWEKAQQEIVLNIESGKVNGCRSDELGQKPCGLSMPPVRLRQVKLRKTKAISGCRLLKSPPVSAK